jgi:2-polyprenyl-3-methyl-5-hydroxy-6-metoxy-1,4-benzoquinol methylase
VLTIDPEGEEIAALAAFVPTLDGARVVEIGCGDGRLTRRYARRAASVLAIDPDEAAIAARLCDGTEPVTEREEPTETS